MLPLHPVGSCLISMSTLGERFCYSSNRQEVASHSGCYHEYRLSLDGEPHAAKHCELPFGGDTLVLEGRPYPKKHCKLPARRGGNATQHEIAEIHCDGRSHAEEHCELHNTANHTLCTQSGAQEAIIVESVMLIMEQHQSTSTRPAALRHTAEHWSHTTRRRREPAKPKHRQRNLEEAKGAEPGKKDK